MKIVLNEHSPADKSDRASCSYEIECERAIQDLLCIQDSTKMYINEKKQLQSLIYKLHELGYYAKYESVLDDLGISILQ